ncbi:MAG: dihydropteroate synthase [Hyphomicrobiaceae bacterium]
MLREIYVRPLGLYASRHGDAAEEVWGGFRLAEGWLDFSAVEVIERNGSEVERRIAGIGEFLERDWGRRALNAADMFEYIRQPRPRVSGLALDAPKIMGIVNVTPDSFFDGDQFDDSRMAIDHAKRLVDEGADILDIGGESTRPGSEAVPLDEELARVLPVIEGLAGKVDARLSIDSRKSEVMRRALQAGVDIVNDVSALTYDPNSMEIVADAGVPVVLMHAQGDPKTMQDDPFYEDVTLDVFDYLEARVEACLRAGIPRHRLIVDPGIGFGKTLEHNLQLLSELSLLHGLGLPILVGASRKSFIGKLTAAKSADERLPGSLAAAVHAVGQGAQIIRVHDAAETRQAIQLWQGVSAGIPDDILSRAQS